MFDVRKLTEEKRVAAAARIRTAKDVSLPTLKYFNSSPCAKHTDLVHSCPDCGIRFRKHQRVGITWLYLVKKGLLADSVGTGKCQGLSAKVLTPTGWKLMGDIKVGDAVIDPEGCADSVVTGVFPQGEKDVYRVTFSDGTTAESSLEHFWKVRGPKGRYLTRVSREPREGIKWRVETLEQIKESIEKPGNHNKRAVPLIEVAPDFAEQDLPIDPYLLGLLLGDGSFTQSGVQITSADQEILDSVNSLVEQPLRYRGKYDYDLPGGRSNYVAKALQDLGLWGHRSWEKFVPESYKLASVKTRLAVLQGLMDTDGNWSSEAAEFCSTSEQLAWDVADLARSLGLRTSNPRRRITSYAYKGEKKQGRPSYRVSIVDTEEFKLFRLERKLKPRAGKRVRGDLTNAGKREGWARDQRVKWIRSIEFVRKEKTQCISVSAPSHLYVTDNWTVTHNTAHAAGLLAMLKESGELTPLSRAIVVARPGAVPQWQNQLKRFTPDINVAVATGSPKQRNERYAQPWDVLLMGYQMLCRDWEKLTMHIDIRTLIIDDVDALRNETDTAYAIGRVAMNCDRVVDMTATPVQKRLMDLYRRYQLLGGRQLLGNKATFERNYVINTKPPSYKNLDHFVRVTEPLVLRRTARDIDDVDLPAVNPVNVFLDLYPAQMERYEELKQGVLRIIKEEGEQVKQATAIAKFIYGMQICGGLVNLDEDDRPGTSVKLDWITDKLVDGDLSDEKVVVFLKFKKSVRALQGRLLEAGVGFETIWGEQPDKFIRQQSQDRFWRDDNCRVLIGTEAIEQSLNLQVARHLINGDMILNPARMQQLSGRIRRDGSAFKSVYVHNLLATDTQEDGYLDMLKREQALADFIHGETNELFEGLSPLAMLQLIGSSGSRVRT